MRIPGSSREPFRNNISCLSNQDNYICSFYLFCFLLLLLVSIIDSLPYTSWFSFRSIKIDMTEFLYCSSSTFGEEDPGSGEKEAFGCPRSHGYYVADLRQNNSVIHFPLCQIMYTKDERAIIVTTFKKVCHDTIIKRWLFWDL